jgi:hypothetical protein
MIQLGILLTKNYKLLSVAAILDVFETVNKFYLADGNSAPFQVNLLALADDIELQPTIFGYTKQLVNEANVNLILIPAFTTDNMPENLAAEPCFYPLDD